MSDHLRFDAERRAACAAAEDALRQDWTLPNLEIRTFDGAAERALRAWSVEQRGRSWPWSTLVREGREDDSAAFEAVLWHGDMLCGLAHGRGGQGVCGVEFIESNPEPAHPLRGWVLRAVVRTAVGYTAILQRPELRLIRPRPHVVTRLQRDDPTISLVPAGPGPHYLSIPV